MKAVAAVLQGLGSPVHCNTKHKLFDQAIYLRPTHFNGAKRFPTKPVLCQNLAAWQPTETQKVEGWLILPSETRARVGLFFLAQLPRNSLHA